MGDKPANLPVMRPTHQPQDRQGARPHHPGNAVGHGRRGDPVAEGLKGPWHRRHQFAEAAFDTEANAPLKYFRTSTELIPKGGSAPGFDTTYSDFDASEAVCLRSPLSIVPAEIIAPTFPQRSLAFDDSSLRWLGISDLIAEPEGPSFISHTVTQRRVDRRYSWHKTRSGHAAGKDDAAQQAETAAGSPRRQWPTAFPG
jgi:hypothetical protein